jgi:ribosomal protein S18 acetylase RimI-like enzyme
MSSAEFRGAAEDDADAISGMVYSMWFRRDYGETLGQAVSDAYARFMLAGSDFGIAAEVGGRVLGVCLVSVGDKKEPDMSMFEDLRRMDGHEKPLSDMALLHDADKKLMIEGGLKTDSEILLLIVDGRCRGMGIGKKLVDLAFAELAERGCSSFHLFTDDECGFGFYDRLGMRRAGECDVPFGPYVLKRMVYVGRVPTE